MNINTNISNDDPGRPAAFTNTVYESLKANPQRTQQVLQQGPNAGLAWLGAAAADRYQQHAMNQQKAQEAAQFGQNPQPTIAQQLQMAAMQGGIMGQLPNNMQMAQQPPAPQGTMGLGDLPVDPNTLPQEGMAGGGLVALAQGGYLDADGSGSYEPVGESYASGGQIRGFSAGSNGALQANTDDEEEETLRLMGLSEAYANAIENGEPLPETRTETPIFAIAKTDKGGRNGEVPLSHEGVKNPKAEVHKEAQKVDKDVKKTLRDDVHLADIDIGRGVSDMGTQAAMRSPDAEGQIQEARDLRQADETAQGGLPAIQAQQPQQQSTSSVEDQLAKILALRGGAPSDMSSEERAWRQEQVASANKEKWLQALTAMAGGVFAGGGRTWPEAIGQGALYGLSAYRQGAAAESEAELGLLNRNAQIQEAQRKAQEEAADKLLAIQAEKMKLGSASEIAANKARSDWAKTQFTEIGKDRRAAMGATGAKDQSQILENVQSVIEKRLKDIQLVEGIVTQADRDRVTREVYAELGMNPPGLGGGAGIAGGQGIGNRPILTRSGIIQ